MYIRRFLLPTGEYVSCVLWNNLFHISGTDIVRCLSFRFQAFGRPVKNPKKFEEGIFSDLRNLKAGTDASLEEPKSPFLDFLYKNNCIRTQKKQKVFYWYSVPHDRLFLDALERDLKREKMGQEATTQAVAEPALSFEFDSSQSLFEQLTKAQQANTSSFNAHASTFSTSASPIMRAMDSMPPPSMIPQQTMTMASDDLSQYGSFNPMTMQAKQSEDYSQQFSYDARGMSMPNRATRHVSIPQYMEYSPAPSFASSAIEDYNNRGLSYEPITPPQQLVNISEPQYLSAEAAAGMYGPLDPTGQSALSGMSQLPLPTVGGIAPTFASTPRGYAANVYSVIEGSPTYKQRRRRSSIPPGLSALSNGMTIGRAPSTERAQSELINLEESYEDNSGSLMQNQEYIDLSRHATPMSMLEGSPAPNGQIAMLQHEHGIMPRQLSVGLDGSGLMNRPTVIRRARSATADISPYPQKSHSCPIPSCGRTFKRLEHLKR